MVFAATVLLGGFPNMTLAEEIDLTPLLPLWDRAISVRTAAGYKDNVFLGRTAPVASGFISTGLEFLVWRRPEEGKEFSFSLTGDDLRYLSLAAADKEQTVFVNTQYRHDLGRHWQVGIAAEYFYQDQVLDVSETETTLTTVRVLGQTLRAAPALRRSVGAGGWMELSFPVTRQFFAAPLDDYWEGGPQFTAGRAYGNKSEWSVSYSSARRSFDDRAQTDSAGFALQGSRLDFHQHKAELAWRHNWDTRRRWRTTTKLGYRVNEDNGEGFFNFNKPQASLKLRYRASTWEISGEAKISLYHYRVQTVGGPGTPRRERLETAYALRAEKYLAPWVKCFAEFEHERTLGNLPLDEYSVRTVTGGVIWEF